MKFITDRRYWSEDGYEMYVCGRFDRTNLLRVEVGFGFPANYKIRIDYRGYEWIRAKGRMFRVS